MGLIKIMVLSSCVRTGVEQRLVQKSSGDMLNANYNKYFIRGNLSELTICFMFLLVGNILDNSKGKQKIILLIHDVLITFGLCAYAIVAFIEVKYHEDHPHPLAPSPFVDGWGPIFPGHHDPPYMAADNMVTLFNVASGIATI